MSKSTTARPKVTGWPTLEELIKRDNASCWLCQGKYGPVTPETATRDHVIAKSHGGQNKAWNLRLSHDFCNRARGNRKVSQKAIEQVKAFRRELVQQQRRIRQEWRAHVEDLAERVEIPEDFFAVAAYEMWLGTEHQKPSPPVD